MVAGEQVLEWPNGLRRFEILVEWAGGGSGKGFLVGGGKGQEVLAPRYVHPADGMEET